jgi:hypothetical protein
MSDDTRDTWPAPPDGIPLDELPFKDSLLLMHLKLDVMGRELFQAQRQIKAIEESLRKIDANLDATMNEVRRHGQCLAPVTLIPVEDLAHD